MNNIKNPKYSSKISSNGKRILLHLNKRQINYWKEIKNYWL